MRTATRPGLLVALLLLCVATPTFGQEVPSRADRMFGFEFEFAGAGNRVVRFEEMPWENYEKLMRVVVEHYNGDPTTIRKVDFTKPTTNLEAYPSGERELFRAEWSDPRGRKWIIEPEFVASTGYDGYELVTPPLTDPEELKKVLDRVRASGLVREAQRSGVHLTIDGRGLVRTNGDAKALVNLMLMHENAEPMLRRMFNPVRGGGHENYFSRGLAMDHEDLLKEIDALRLEERTRERLEGMFRAREAREASIHAADPMDPSSWSKVWKYRSMNVAKALNINNLHDGNKGVVEFRMFDLHALEDPEIHRLQAELYRAMVAKSVEMAARGETVKYRPRANQPAGEDPSVYNTPKDPAEAKARARELIESVGLDPEKFEPLLEKNVARHRNLRTPSEFEGLLRSLPGGRVEHNGKAFTYGFELEGSGEGFARLLRPKDAEVNGRWDSMSTADKKAYYRSVVGENRRSVPTHFDLDLERFPFLDPSWKVEGTGNWEIRSKVFESIKEATDNMRLVKELTGRSAKGFHLHMRDNAPDWDMLGTRGSEFADFIERSSNWIWLERARRLGTMTSMKSWSNARMHTDVLDKLANLSPDNWARATVRAQIPSDRSYIDLEIRGFSLFVDDIERLGKIYTDALKTGNFGPWKHTDNPLANKGQGDAPESLRFVDHMEKYLRDVEGKEMTPEMRKVIDGLQHDYGKKAKGDARTYSTNVATALLPWESEASIPESLRRTLKMKREDFLRSLRYTANKVMNGDYGLDLSVASEAGLIRHLDVTPEEAKALVEHRRNGGKLESPEDVARVLARGTDAGKLSLLNGVDLNEVDDLRERFNLSEEDAKKLTDYRNAHDAMESLERAGVPEAEIMRMIDASGGLDLNSATATPEKMAERLGISLEAAKKIDTFRTAHEINGAADLEKAGLTAEEAARVISAAGRALDLKTASAEELKGLGLSDAEVEKVLDARKGKAFERYTDLRGAGVSEDVISKLKRARGINLSKLGELSAEEIARLGRISAEDARKIVEFRGGKDVSSESVLRDVLGWSRGNEVHKAAKAVELANATKADLEARGVNAELAKKIVSYRDANRVGSSSGYYSNYDSERAATDLREAGILSEAEAERVRIHSKEIDIEKADAKTLSERFGLDADVAERAVTFRDFNKLDLEGLKKAGLTEAEATRVFEAARALDASTASLAELATRTGISEERLIKALGPEKVDLTRLSAEDLSRRLGIELADAKKLVEARTSGNTLGTLEKLTEAGLSEATAKKVLERAKGVDWSSVTAEELRNRAGMSETEAAKLERIMAKAKNAEGLNYDEISRQVRFKTRKYAKETSLSEALMRSLLPRPNPNNVTVVDPTAPNEGEGFARTRTGRAGDVRASKISLETVSSVFEGVRNAAVGRFAERAATVEDASTKAALERGAERINELKLEVVKTNDILAEHAEGKVRVSSGLLNEIYLRSRSVPPAERGAFRMRVLGLIMGHETSHAGGIKAESVADGEAVKVLERSALGVDGKLTKAELVATLKVFDKPVGSSHVDNFFNRLRNLLRYGTSRGRLANLERNARGEADPLARYRRTDGTLKWKELTRDRALREVGGLAHFGLALFLKEVATVAATGDRARIEEFFDGLMTTDFYKHYGLFVAGARVGEVAYIRYLQRYIKPTFVNGLLKTNLVLAAGIALPMIVEGQFEGKAFAITLGSLGLSSAAVHAGVRSIKWVMNLKKARQTGALAKAGVNIGRMAKIGGWFYTAAELAVVLYFAEKIEHRVHAYLDLKKAREDLAKAGRDFVAATSDPNATPESIKAALDKHHEAWIAYRNFLYGPLFMDEALLAERLKKLARRAKIKADERKAAVDRITAHPALKRSIERRYGSVEKYADGLVEKAEAELDESVNTYVDSFNMNRKKHLEEVYEDNKRGEPLFADIENVDWLVGGARTGATGDPYGSRTDSFANWGRERARAGLGNAYERASKNKMEAYDDEREVLALLGAWMRDNGKDSLAKVVDEHRDRVSILKAADKALMDGNGTINLTDRKGITERITGTTRDGE